MKKRAGLDQDGSGGTGAGRIPAHNPCGRCPFVFSSGRNRINCHFSPEFDSNPFFRFASADPDTQPQGAVPLVFSSGRNRINCHFSPDFGQNPFFRLASGGPEA